MKILIITVFSFLFDYYQTKKIKIKIFVLLFLVLLSILLLLRLTNHLGIFESNLLFYNDLMEEKNLLIKKISSNKLLISQKEEELNGISVYYIYFLNFIKKFPRNPSFWNGCYNFLFYSSIAQMSYYGLCQFTLYSSHVSTYLIGEYSSFFASVIGYFTYPTIMLASAGSFSPEPDTLINGLLQKDLYKGFHIFSYSYHNNWNPYPCVNAGFFDPKVFAGLSTFIVGTTIKCLCFLMIHRHLDLGRNPYSDIYSAGVIKSENIFNCPEITEIINTNFNP